MIGETKDERLARGRQAKRRFDDRQAAIDGEMDLAFSEIDWTRRNAAESSIEAWVKTYCVGLLLDDAPPPKGVDVLNEMTHAITAHENYLICLPRGSGKSSYCECVALYALALGLQKYVAIISHNATNAKAILGDLWRAIQTPDTPLAQDYPQLCLPFQLCNGCTRRRQLYRGQSTEIGHNASSLIFATLRDKTSGGVMTARGISSGFRGMKHGTTRPSLVLLDDLQDSAQAENSEQIEKLLSLIKKDIMNLGGKERLSILHTATPICPDDLVERLKNDPAWRTTIHRAVERFPDDLAKGESSLWRRYFELYQTESITGESHAESLNFYRENREAMDAGAEVFNPFRFSESDGHISALQKLLEIRQTIGEAAFQSEYQMQPLKRQFTIDITPAKLIPKIGTEPMLHVPDGFQIVCAALDLNTSYAITALLMAFRPDTTAHVLWHEIYPCRIDSAMPDMAYNQAVHAKLLEVCNALKALGIPINAVAIDGGGRNFQAVTNFTRTASAQVGLPLCAFVGRSATMFNPFIRSRLRDAIGRTVLAGDAQEHLRSGTGAKYVFFDADYYKETFQKSLIAPLGSVGSCSLFKAPPELHRDFMIQVCNEQLLSITRKSGREVYAWKSKEPHDLLDCGAMCLAASCQRGIGTAISQQGRTALSRRFIRHRPAVRIV